MLKFLKQHEKKLGFLGSTLAIIMFVALIEVAMENYNTDAGIWMQPAATIMNCSVWVMYGIARADIFVFSCNAVGVVAGIGAVITAFI